MERHELTELHYIAPIDNLTSMLVHGILSHQGAARLRPKSVAMPEIQERRAGVRVPGGRRLHEYVNLYICARNPMLFKLRDSRDQLCVVSISPDVLDLDGVVVSDGNASGDYVRFAMAPAGLRIVNRELTFAEYWTDNDPIVYYRKKTAKCAEVLVPDRVELRYIHSAYVWSDDVARTIHDLSSSFRVHVNAQLFFA